MQAIVCRQYGPPEVLQLREVEKPKPGANEICIQIFTTAVTASDCMIRGFHVSRKYRLPMRIAIGFQKPRKAILGMVFAGVVESAGKDVKTFKKGDSVTGFDRFGFGTYSEYKCISVNGLVVKKAEHISYEVAAAIPYGGLLALYFLRKGNIQKGQRVLIYGASGAVGTAAVQLAKHFGAEVTGVCSSANLELVKSLGAVRVINYTKEDFTSESTRYDLIFNAVGKNKATLECNETLTQYGKHITVDDGTAVFHVEDLVFLNDLAGNGEMKPIIDRCYPLEQIVEAHRYVEKGHKRGNVIITVNNMSN